MSTRCEVPFLDLGRVHASMRESLSQTIDSVIADSAFIGGERVAEAAALEILSLPIDPLMAPDDVDYVVRQLRACANT